MTRIHVADLMAEHRGELRFVAQERHDAAREVDVPARQRERVHGRLVDDGERPWKIRTVRRAHQTIADVAHVPLQLGVLVETHLLPDFGIRLLAELDLFGLGHQDDLPAPGRRIGRAAGGHENDRQRAGESHVASCSRKTSRRGRLSAVAEARRAVRLTMPGGLDPATPERVRECVRNALDVGRRRARSHQSDSPDFAGERTEARANLDMVTLQETCPDGRFVHAGRHAHGIQTPEAFGLWREQ